VQLDGLKPGTFSRAHHLHQGRANPDALGRLEPDSRLSDSRSSSFTAARAFGSGPRPRFDRTRTTDAASACRHVVSAKRSRNASPTVSRDGFASP
jgi:hypothetical protein